MELEEAKAQGAAALFGEKYDSEVRVIEMGPNSMELCGGTHVERTGDIGLFRIIQESSIASGIRRIEALTGMDAVQRMQADSQLLSQVARTLHTGVGDVQEKVEQMIQANRAMDRQISDLKTQLATGGNGVADIAIKSVGDVQVLVSRHDGIDVKDLRKIMARMQQKIESGVVVLGSVNNGKATLLCSVSDDLVDRLHAGKIISKISPLVGGNGGGKPQMAQGGGTEGEKIDIALDAVAEAIA